MVGLKKDIKFDEELQKSITVYKKILHNINAGRTFDEHEHLFVLVLDELKICMVNLLIMQGLTDEEMNKREIYIDKFISVLDTAKALNDLHRE
jgi:hypothetical protein